MKSIEITGKRNIEGMSNIKNPQRKSVTSWNIDVSYFTYLKQIKLINSLYLEQSVEHAILAKREITKKIKGYFCSPMFSYTFMQENSHSKTDYYRLVKSLLFWAY